MISGTDWRARLVWALARLTARVFYRLERLGHTPPDGPVLLVANHPNGLMDPAVVAATAGRPVRFLAKSTLFGGHPLSFVIRWSRSIPVYRRIDAGADVSRNVEMFAAVEQALAQGDAVCLFPEGLTHSTGRLEQLRTGAARIVIGCAVRDVKVAIVPIGLNFDHKARFRSRATAAYGRPFCGDDLLKTGETDLPPTVRALTDRMAVHLRNLIIEADPRTEADIVSRVDELYSAARGRGSHEERLERRRLIASGMAELRTRDPNRYDALREKVRIHDARLSRFGLRERDIHLRTDAGTVMRFTLRELLYALLAGPIAFLGLVVFVVPYWLTGRITKAAGIVLETRGGATAVIGLFVYGFWTLALAGAAALWLRPAAGSLVLLFVPTLSIGALYAIEREASVVKAVRAYFAVRRAPESARRRLARRQAEIADVLDQAREWLTNIDRLAN